jgi:hypothetical protein
MGVKSILLTAALTLGLTAATMAQVPNYVPTNGLVGWWPFNGNANDESVNTNDGTVNGPILTTDRYGATDSAYNFDGVDDYIDLGDITSLDNVNAFSVAVFFNYSNLPTLPNDWYTVVADGSYADIDGWGILIKSDQILMRELDNFNGIILNYNFTQNNWYHIVATCESDSIKIFINGQFIGSSLNLQANLTLNTSNSFRVGNGTMTNVPPNSWPYYLSGKIDDLGLWNRALTQQEITYLYNAVNCSNNLSISPSNNQLQTGANANFNAITSDPSPIFVWQSDFGQGFQTLNNFGNYSGANSATLNIANIQLAEHNQPIRVISTSGNCIDTSNVAVINILDTCITNVTVYDTLLTSVTDTLVINTQITGINPPNNLNTLKVFPNPASTHITIDYGNFNAMSGYTLTIINSVGQTVFTAPINQQTSYIDLSTWTGNGIYFVQLIDPQNNTIENRKIVIQ